MAIPQFVHMFDESLCKATQTKQMGCHVRFCVSGMIPESLLSLWGMEMQQNRLTAAMNHFIRGLHEKYTLQISIDGLSVNWIFMKMLVMIFSVMTHHFNLYSYSACTSFMAHLKMG